MIQWTLAIELRGSFLVYLTLVVTGSFTPFYRRVVFMIILSYTIYLGDLLGENPFFFGALLADLSLSLQNKSVSASTSKSSNFQNYWPVALAIFGLYISSYPTNNAHLAGWSRFLTDVAHIIFHPDCIFLSCVSDDQGNFAGRGHLLVLSSSSSQSTFHLPFDAYFLTHTPYSLEVFPFPSTSFTPF
jgi:hypothetical protein